MVMYRRARQDANQFVLPGDDSPTFMPVQRASHNPAWQLSLVWRTLRWRRAYTGYDCPLCLVATGVPSTYQYIPSEHQQWCNGLRGRTTDINVGDVYTTPPLLPLLPRALQPFLGNDSTACTQYVPFLPVATDLCWRTQRRQAGLCTARDSAIPAISSPLAHPRQRDADVLSRCYCNCLPARFWRTTNASCLS